MALGIRHRDIMEAARIGGHVEVEELAERFTVTPQTIRRDLNELCERGLLTRVHGGAMIASGAANLGYEARRDIAVEGKGAIAALCAEQVPHNASLFINIGTTTEAVARELLGHRDLLVITNNMNVANTLTRNPHCEVIVAGGVLRRSDNALIGEATVDFIEQFKVDFAIIGASAIDEDGALLDYDYREVRVAQAIIANARKTYLVADASKLARTAPVRIGEIGQVDTFFTDHLESPKLRRVCRDLGVRLVTLSESGSRAAPDDRMTE